MDISVIIPVYNRGDLIRYSMESVRRASAGLQVETIVVDDGSATPVADDLAKLGYANGTHVIRQTNQGLLRARLVGLAAATGRHVMFLDSDDLVAPEKLRRQVAQMETNGAHVSYSDMARCNLTGDYDSLAIRPDEPAHVTSDAADFFINVQPAPHSPIFRTDFLRDVVSRAFFPPSPLYNSVAEIWFYHNAAPRAAPVLHVPGPLTIGGSHSGTRLTNHWERLAVGALAVMEAFARTVPATAEHDRARRFVAEKAFRSWRRLPRNFLSDYDRRLLQVWSTLRPVPEDYARLGGTAFQQASRFCGPEIAGRIFRRWQNGPYDRIRTMPDADLRALLATLPPP